VPEPSISCRSYAGAQESHSHPHHQIVLPLEGAMAFEAGRGAGLVAGSTGAIAAAGERHAYCAEAAARFLILDVAGAPGHDPLVELAERGSFFSLGPELGGLLQYARAAAPRLERRPALAGHLSVLILAGLGAGDGAGRPRQLGRALDFVRASYQRPIGVGDMARAAAVGTTRLTRLFDAWLGTTPGAYLARVRLDRAQLLLEESDLSVAEIALRVGYADQAALTRAFARRRGTTPGAIRRRARPMRCD